MRLGVFELIALVISSAISKTSRTNAAILHRVDPDDAALVNIPPNGSQGARRLKSLRPSGDGSASTREGARAAGVPVLFDGNAPPLAAVPKEAHLVLKDCDARVTRGDELQRVVDELCSSNGGGCRTVILTGGARVGKKVLAARQLPTNGLRSSSETASSGCLWEKARSTVSIH